MRTRRELIAYADTRRFSRLVLDHVGGDPFLDDFRHYPPTLQGLRDAAAKRAFPSVRRASLVQALRAQYGSIPLGEAVQRSLDLLQRNDALTVTTGHQLCLFLGPQYVTFKLLNAVRLAHQLSTVLNRPVVPVFWMATEDHDRAEIDHAWIDGAKVHWPGASAGAVGRMPLEGIGAALEEAERMLGDTAGARDLAALLRDCYAPQRSLAEATRRFAHALFGRYGLVVADGDDRALKQHFVPVLREELINGIAQRAVAFADERLGVRYGPQAHARAINVFHLRPGHRARIERQGDHFQVLNGGPRFTLEELLLDLELRPQDYSPNVLLRPVYQEVVLPNIAYIGGGGELAYWMQLRWLFDAVRVPMPAVLLRNSAQLVPASMESLRNKLGLEVTDLFAEAHDLENRVARAAAGITTDVAEERALVEAAMERLARRATAVDPTLMAHVAAASGRMQKLLSEAAKRMDRAVRRRESIQVDRARRLLAGLFPGAGLLERRESILPWIAAYGPGFLDELLEALDPLDSRFTVLTEA